MILKVIQVCSSYNNGIHQLNGLGSNLTWPFYLSRSYAAQCAGTLWKFWGVIRRTSKFVAITLFFLQCSYHPGLLTIWWRKCCAATRKVWSNKSKLWCHPVLVGTVTVIPCKVMLAWAHLVLMRPLPQQPQAVPLAERLQAPASHHKVIPWPFQVLSHFIYFRSTSSP